MSPVAAAQRVPDSLPEGFEPVTPPAAQNAPAPTPESPPALPEGFEPVPTSELRPISAAPPSFLDRIAQGTRVMDRLGSIWKATKEGFGDRPLSEDTGMPNGLSNLVKRPVEAYDLLTRTINAGIHGTADIAAQAVEAGGGSQGWQERAREDVLNFGTWLMSEGGMRATMADAAKHAPLVDAGNGDLARIVPGPDGRATTQVVGKFPPAPADFENAAAAITKTQDQFTNLEGHMADRMLKERIPTVNGKQVAAAAEGSGTTFPPANSNAAKPEPLGIETRGEGVQYHGSSDPNLQPYDTHYSTRNYYGQGFYTTDAADVAFGYSKRGARETGARNVYRVDENSNLKIYDMEKPIPKELVDAIKPPENSAPSVDDLLANALDEKPKNLRELYDAIREQSASDMIPSDEVQGIFDNINYHLQQMGYRGMEHTGGMRTNTAAHRVVIYFNPESDLSLTKVAAGSIESKLHQMWEEQGLHPAEVAEDAKDDAFLAHDLGAAATHPTEIPPLVSPDVQPVSIPGRILNDLRSAKDTTFSVGRWIEKQLTPISSSPDYAVRYATEFLSSLRRVQWDWNRYDDMIAKKFSPEQRQAMWRAMDEESVMAQSGERSEHMGLNTLTPEEQAAVRELSQHAMTTRMQMLDRGMVTTEGLPHYVPRLFKNKGQSEPISLGPDVRIRETTGTMKQRKYLTAEESEAAAKAKFGPQTELIQDIKTLPLVLAKQQRAIAAHDFIEGVRKFGQDIGDAQIVEGAKPTEGKWFTIPDSDLADWYFRSNGDTTFATKQPMHIKAEWEGAVQAIRDAKFNNFDKFIAEIKNRPMSLIMNSPFIHASVVYSKALPSNPGNMLSFRFMRQGSQLLSDPKFMKDMIDGGLVLWGRRPTLYQDVAGLMEGPQLEPGRSLTSRALAYIPGLFDEAAGTKVKMTVDKIGEIVHDKILAESVQKLQASLAYDFREAMRQKHPDIPDNVLNVLAAHEANRFGGSLPPEAMSAFSRGLANAVLFSRQFTLGNLGILKDAAKGPPEYVMARVREMLGPEGAEHALSIKSDMRRHAFAVVAMDLAMYYVANSVLQSGIHVASGTPMSDEVAGYLWRLKQAVNRVEEHPMSLASYLSFLPSMSPTFYHEPGKEGKLLLGYREDGTAIYGRSVIGRMGEDYTGLLVNPAVFALTKMAPLPRAFNEVIGNKDGFDRPIYDPKALKAGDITQAWKIAQHFIEAELPMQQIKGAANLIEGTGDYKDAISTFGPYMVPPFTLTASQGYPGGPIAGAVAGHQRDQRVALDLAMSGIKEMVQKQNDILGARQKMGELGVRPPQQNALIRAWQHPGLSKTSPRAMAEFYQHASPIEREILDGMLNGPR